MDSSQIFRHRCWAVGQFPLCPSDRAWSTSFQYDSRCRTWSSSVRIDQYSRSANRMLVRWYSGDLMMLRREFDSWDVNVPAAISEQMQTLGWSDRRRRFQP
jgi:hypothetical protein